MNNSIDINLLIRIKEVVNKFDNNHGVYQIDDIDILFYVDKKSTTIDIYRCNKRHSIKLPYAYVEKIVEKRYQILGKTYVDDYIVKEIDTIKMINKVRKSAVDIYDGIQKLSKIKKN